MMKLLSSPSPGLGTSVAFDVPVTPDAEQARRWAQEELAKKEYIDGRPGLLSRILDWIRNFLDELLSGVASPQGAWGLVILVIVIALVIAVIVFLVRPSIRRRKIASIAVFEGAAQLSAQQHRQRARSAADSGDFGTAVFEQFRALVRSGEERDLLFSTTGRTAQEITHELSLAFPSHADQLVKGGLIFDAVRYGRSEAQQQMFADLLELDKELLVARPQHNNSVISDSVPS